MKLTSHLALSHGALSAKSEVVLKEKEKPETFEVPHEGNLGLLALGYRGLIAWREARDKAQKDHPTSEES